MTVSAVPSPLKVEQEGTTADERPDRDEGGCEPSGSDREAPALCLDKVGGRSPAAHTTLQALFDVTLRLLLSLQPAQENAQPCAPGGGRTGGGRVEPPNPSACAPAQSRAEAQPEVRHPPPRPSPPRPPVVRASIGDDGDEAVCPADDDDDEFERPAWVRRGRTPLRFTPSLTTHASHDPSQARGTLSRVVLCPQDGSAPGDISLSLMVTQSAGRPSLGAGDGEGDGPASYTQRNSQGAGGSLRLSGGGSSQPQGAAEGRQWCACDGAGFVYLRFPAYGFSCLFFDECIVVASGPLASGSRSSAFGRKRGRSRGCSRGRPTAACGSRTPSRALPARGAGGAILLGSECAAQPRSLPHGAAPPCSHLLLSAAV